MKKQKIILVMNRFMKKKRHPYIIDSRSLYAYLDTKYVLCRTTKIV